MFHVKSIAYLVLTALLTIIFVDSSVVLGFGVLSTLVENNSNGYEVQTL